MSHTRVREWRVGFSIWSRGAVARRGALVARFVIQVRGDIGDLGARPRSSVPDGIIGVGSMGGAGCASSSLGQRVLTELLAGGVRLLRAPSGR